MMYGGEEQKKAIKTALAGKGYSSCAEFIEKCFHEEIRPRALDRYLDDIAPVSIKQYYILEAKDQMDLRQRMKFLLMYHLYIEFEYYGWNAGPNWRGYWASAVSAWHTALPWEHEELADSIVDTIEAYPPPDGWRPNSVDDEILTSAFDQVWPIE